jgi:hypothetical protein
MSGIVVKVVGGKLVIEVDVLRAIAESAAASVKPPTATGAKPGPKPAVTTATPASPTNT